MHNHLPHTQGISFVQNLINIQSWIIVQCSGGFSIISITWQNPLFVMIVTISSIMLEGKNQFWHLLRLPLKEFLQKFWLRICWKKFLYLFLRLILYWDISQWWSSTQGSSVGHVELGWQQSWLNISWVMKDSQDSCKTHLDVAPVGSSAVSCNTLIIHVLQSSLTHCSLLLLPPSQYKFKMPQNNL